MLARLLLHARHAVVHTGAGVSTSAGVADFRGPCGVWTRERQTRSEALKQCKAIKDEKTMNDEQQCTREVPFELAAPTLTHMAIVGLYRAGYIGSVVSQNVDALHSRSGLPRDALAELHGNVFVEWCAHCEVEFLRDRQTSTVGFQPTGRTCERCDAPLTDKALDWDDELPRTDHERAKRWSEAADLAIVVGSSCQMDPARSLPFRARSRKRSRADEHGDGRADSRSRIARTTVLINLSRTGMDERFSFCIRARCDDVFALLLKEMISARATATATATAPARAPATLHDLLPRYVREVVVHARSRIHDGSDKPAGGDTNVLECAQVKCDVWADTEHGPSSPFLVDVSFRVADGAAEGDAVIVRRAPFSALLRLGASVRAPRITISVQLRAAPSAPGAQCSVATRPDSDHRVQLELSADGGTARARYVITDSSYVDKACAIADSWCHDASSGAGGTATDTRVWLMRGTGGQRGYVHCAGCDREVWAAQGRQHVGACEGVRVGLR